MKKLLVLAVVAAGFWGVSCEKESYATVKVYNPTYDNPVEFKISYSSAFIDTSDITDFAPQEYSIQVNPDGDHVQATVQKLSADTFEVKVELYYQDKIEDIESTKIPLIPITVEYDIR